jgi:D-sedoheptulose 7-phosphate isomerase
MSSKNLENQQDRVDLSTTNLVKNEIQESYEVHKNLLESEAQLQTIQAVVQQCIDAYKRGNKILVAGNGGSAADALHTGGEILCRFKKDRPPLPIRVLTANISTITAIANDYGYEYVFSRQIQAEGAPGDVFIGLTTSGKSLNIHKALEICKNKNIITVVLTGSQGSEISEVCDYCVIVPSRNTPRIQECHILILHTICLGIEEAIFG